MKLSLSRKSLLCVVMVIAAQSAWAWGAAGHQVIATLAQQQLTPTAQRETERLLSLEPGSSLVLVSTWADEHRNPQTAPWHYVNLPRGDCIYEAQRDCPDGRCVVEAIQKQSDILQSAASDDKKLLACCRRPKTDPLLEVVPTQN